MTALPAVYTDEAASMCVLHRTANDNCAEGSPEFWSGMFDDISETLREDRWRGPTLSASGKKQLECWFVEAGGEFAAAVFERTYKQKMAEFSRARQARQEIIQECRA